jgi:hypothetical protein
MSAGQLGGTPLFYLTERGQICPDLFYIPQKLDSLTFKYLLHRGTSVIAAATDTGGLIEGPIALLKSLDIEAS